MNDQIRPPVGRSQGGSSLSGPLSLYCFSNSLKYFPDSNRPPVRFPPPPLAICVFIAVPFFGVLQKGVFGYLKHYIKPSVFMMPFEVIGEFSRTLALAVRLYGNIMSGTIIVGILLSIAPLFFPIIMQALGLLIGLIQAYIFAVLAMVYIASATSVQMGQEAESEKEVKGGS
jgi:F-type H+-transporting ATPase subunit a